MGRRCRRSVFLIDKSFPMATTLRAAGLICLSRLWPKKENREQDSSSYQEDESSGAIYGLGAEHPIAQISERHERDNGAALAAKKRQWLHAPMILDRSCTSHRGTAHRGRTLAAGFWTLIRPISSSPLE